MSMHLQRRIEKIKRRVLILGGAVEEALGNAVRSVQDRDAELAVRVIRGDERVDVMELELEEECLSVLALEQPVAMDLRFVVGVLKMNNDLERIGDLAANIAGQARFLASEDKVAPPFDLAAMTETVRGMVKQALDSLVERDAEMAERVRATDDDVDARYAGTYAKVEQAIIEAPSQTRQMIHYLSIARMLERIADHSVNIAEDVAYMVRGEIVRHGPVDPEAAEATEAS